MVTKNSPTSSEESSTPPQQTLELGQDGQEGFVGSLVKSVFEPGVNGAVVLAMNTCFFLLVLTLFGLAFLTNWNKHVFLLLGVTILFWASMVWFVMQVTQLQTRPDNMPPSDTDLQSDEVPPPALSEESSTTLLEAKKDR